MVLRSKSPSKIRTKMTAAATKTGPDLPKLYDKQRDAVYDDARYVVIEASTKSGKTAGCIIWQLSRVMRDKNRMSHWWVAPTYQQAKIAMSRVQAMLRRSRAGGLADFNRSSLKATFENGATWNFMTGEKPDNLYGEDVADAVMDEASRSRRESWHAVRSTLTATKGPIRIIGNVKGRGNWMYELARRAESGESEMSYYKLTAWDAVEAGVLDKSEVEDAKEKLPEHVFQELYLAEPSDDGGNPFGYESIDECTIREIDPAQGDTIDWAQGADPVAWGWDLAKSQDWTVGVGLDDDKNVTRFCRWRKPWRATMSEIKRRVGGDPALVDSTGAGDPILEQLQADCPEVEGYNFTSKSKQRLMEGLSVAIQSSEVAYPPGQIVNELEVFEFEHYRSGVRYEAPTGMHDDCVDALGLAVHCAEQHAGGSVYLGSVSF